MNTIRRGFRGVKTATSKSLNNKRKWVPTAMSNYNIKRCEVLETKTREYNIRIIQHMSENIIFNKSLQRASRNCETSKTAGGNGISFHFCLLREQLTC